MIPVMHAQGWRIMQIAVIAYLPYLHTNEEAAVLKTKDSERKATG